mmetsp:Transcript_62960/g.148328  ORF Transcript_62960/g.148328 Transcript_62960/m.148328 type:complete len:348 (+) Transcript_62960:230-1273(+)
MQISDVGRTTECCAICAGTQQRRSAVGRDIRAVILAFARPSGGPCARIALWCGLGRCDGAFDRISLAAGGTGVLRGQLSFLAAVRRKGQTGLASGNVGSGRLDGRHRPAHTHLAVVVCVGRASRRAGLCSAARGVEGARLPGARRRERRRPGRADQGGAAARELLRGACCCGARAVGERRQGDRRRQRRGDAHGHHGGGVVLGWSGGGGEHACLLPHHPPRPPLPRLLRRRRLLRQRAPARRRRAGDREGGGGSVGEGGGSASGGGGGGLRRLACLPRWRQHACRQERRRTCGRTGRCRREKAWQGCAWTTPAAASDTPSSVWALPSGPCGTARQGRASTGRQSSRG